MKSLTQKEVKDLIWQYWKHMADHSPATAFLPLIDVENFKVTVPSMNIIFDGVAGLADMLLGKMVTFDERFIADFKQIKITAKGATAKTAGTWEARQRDFPAAKSQLIRCDIVHTWTIIRCQKTQKPVIQSQVCEKLKYQKGFAPRQAKHEDFHLTAGEKNDK